MAHNIATTMAIPNRSEELMKRNVISIEGNIGSGKSTLLESLKNKYASNPRVVFLDEPVTMWDSIRDQEGITMLEKFYKDQEKYSFPFSNDGIYFTPRHV